MTKRTLTLDRLKELLRYDPETGVFVWIALPSKHSPVSVGDVAGSKVETGYILIGIDGALYRAHRLAWFYVNGTWPVNEIDHRDRNRSNNIYTNLRDATRTINARNTTPRGGASGVTGAFPIGNGKFKSAINTDDGVVYLGCFTTADQAGEAYVAAQKKYHGEVQA